MHLICPLCRETLSPDGQCYACANGHSFDVAREGYIHLLPVQKKKSKAPGDDKMMVAARGRFLGSGHYQAISDAVNRLVERCLDTSRPDPVTIIDSGCGDGYYTVRLRGYLAQQNVVTDMVGVDISKLACRAAAKRCRSTTWLVASSSDIPVQEHSADLILCLFAPIQGPAFKRCLRFGGTLVVASAGPAHLLELRELLYDTVDTRTLDPTRLLAPQFSVHTCGQTHVRYAIDLDDSEGIQDLLAMTPHYWRTAAEKKDRLNSLGKLSVGVDIQISCYSVLGKV